MSCKHGNWSDCEECAQEVRYVLEIQELKGQRDQLAAALRNIATSFEAKTAPEQALMDEASEALSRATSATKETT